MKKFIIVLSVIIASYGSIYTQNDGSSQGEGSGGFTYGEFKADYGITQFSSGLEERFENGNFSTSRGGKPDNFIQGNLFIGINF
jgi:hypothetical protein